MASLLLVVGKLKPIFDSQCMFLFASENMRWRWVANRNGKSQTFCSSVDVTEILQVKAAFCSTFCVSLFDQVDRVIFLSLGENKKCLELPASYLKELFGTGSKLP